MLEVLAAPFAACLVLAGIHCYLGLQVLMRGVIFVDLALAQSAALGAAVASLFAIQPDSLQSYGVSLSMALVVSLLLAMCRLLERRLPMEAVVGIAYAVTSALTVLVLVRSPLQRDEIDAMLVGRLLFVEWDDIAIMTLIYVWVAALHAACVRPMFAIATRQIAGLSRRALWLWDFFFYASFGIVVTSSVEVGGILLVFSLLIVPAACSTLFFAGLRARLIAGWTFGFVGCVAGISASWVLDLPTGAAVVAAFGVIFVVCAVARLWRDGYLARRTQS